MASQSVGAVLYLRGDLAGTPLGDVQSEPVLSLLLGACPGWVLCGTVALVWPQRWVQGKEVRGTNASSTAACPWQKNRPLYTASLLALAPQLCCKLAHT